MVEAEGGRLLLIARNQGGERLRKKAFSEDGGEKISETITSLLTYFVLLRMGSELMPRAGIQVPYISQYQLHIWSTVVCILYCVEFAFGFWDVFFKVLAFSYLLLENCHLEMFPHI